MSEVQCRSRRVEVDENFLPLPGIKPRILVRVSLRILTVPTNALCRHLVSLLEIRATSLNAVIQPFNWMGQ